MKVIVTGSLGNISKPLTKELLQKGHTVTVISSDPEKQDHFRNGTDMLACYVQCFVILFYIVITHLKDCFIFIIKTNLIWNLNSPVV